MAYGKVESNFKEVERSIKDISRKLPGTGVIGEIVNEVPYGPAVEYGGAASWRRYPASMLGNAMANIESDADNRFAGNKGIQSLDMIAEVDAHLDVAVAEIQMRTPVLTGLLRAGFKKGQKKARRVR